MTDMENIMAKTIVFCADGTWDGPGESDSDDKPAQTTNVFKIYLNLAGADTPDNAEKERARVLLDAGGAVLQVAEYLHGVGDSDNFLVRTLGGTIGAGLVTRIVRGYTFISRNYRDGDKIFIVGFSRGAYTARALAGLIANEGLLDATKIDLTDKIHAYRLGSAVWFANRRKVNARINASWFDRLEGIVADLPGLLTQTPPADKLIPAPIEAVAVWDTVGALGIPEFTMTLERVDAFQFADRKLSPAVQHGVHAVAVDEQRADFEPTLWDPDPRIVQALFPGAHGDVGGGFPVSGNESGLSDCTLSWMIGQLTGLGVQFAATPAYHAMPGATGVAHQPWTQPPWNVLLRRPREFPSTLCLTQCLLDRLNGGPVVAAPGEKPEIYAPGNLKDYLAGGVPAPGIPIA
jgi:uncharacterized protein (DUF2235 family)